MDLPEVTASSTLAEQLYETLEGAIINGRLRPGERLVAEELASHFGVSRIPLRECLRALDANGWVEIRARHGSYVRRRSLEELQDLFEVRTMLEGHAARLAAARRTEEQLAELRRLVVDGRVAATAKDQQRVAEINRAFHGVVAECTNNKVMSSTLKKLSLRVQWYFSTVSVDRGKHSMEEHARLVDALQSGYGDAAADIIVHHISETKAAVETAVSHELEREST